jgi:hydrogenase nickel incorporation protein HypA/HybF
MHEMAIAQSVLDIAFGEMEKRAARRVQKIKITIGEFSGVVKDALEFAFDVLKPDTPASLAEIEIEVVPLTAECGTCGPVACRLNDLNLLCSGCGETMTINSGREMRVEYLDLD